MSGTTAVDPGGDPAALEQVTVTERDPVLPAASSSAPAAANIWAAALAAAELWRLRCAAHQPVAVDMRAAAAAFRSERYLGVEGRIDGLGRIDGRPRRRRSPSPTPATTTATAWGQMRHVALVARLSGTRRPARGPPSGVARPRLSAGCLRVSQSVQADPDCPPHAAAPWSARSDREEGAAGCSRDVAVSNAGSRTGLPWSAYHGVIAGQRADKCAGER